MARGKRPATRKTAAETSVDTARASIEDAERRARCTKLRAAGWDWTDIAEACGYRNAMVAQQDFDRAIRETPSQEVESIRWTLDAGYRRIIRANMSKALQGNARNSDVCLKAMKDLAILHGALRPEAINQTNVTANVLAVSTTPADAAKVMRDLFRQDLLPSGAGARALADALDDDGGAAVVNGAHHARATAPGAPRH